MNGAPQGPPPSAARERLPELSLFSTCPPSDESPPALYPEQVRTAARWSEAAGCRGMLVYTDNRRADPWALAQLILQSTERLTPLVAVQPVYMHPYTVAKMMTTLAVLYGRAVHLNLVAGGFRNDLIALGDETPHDERYERLIEYCAVLSGLLAGGPVTFSGRHYRVRALALDPPIDPALRGALFMSGSSSAGLRAAEEVGALAVRYAGPAAEESSVGPECSGMRVGIIARADARDAWRAAEERFPADRRGQLTHQLAMKVSDSHWHRQLSALESGRGEGEEPFWLSPFANYQSACPYLIGSYGRVAAELDRYVALGYRTFILDVARGEDDLAHAHEVFNRVGRVTP